MEKKRLISVAKIKRDAETVSGACGMDADEFRRLIVAVLEEDVSPANTLKAIGADLDNLMKAYMVGDTVSEAIALLFLKLGRARISGEDYARAFVLFKNLERAAGEATKAVGDMLGRAHSERDAGSPDKMFG